MDSKQLRLQKCSGTAQQLFLTDLESQGSLEFQCCAFRAFAYIHSADQDLRGMPTDTSAFSAAPRAAMPELLAGNRSRRFRHFPCLVSHHNAHELSAWSMGAIRKGLRNMPELLLPFDTSTLLLMSTGPDGPLAALDGSEL